MVKPDGSSGAEHKVLYVLDAHIKYFFCTFVNLISLI